MKRIFWVSLIVLFSASLWSEDLAEVAKKEKARREALKKQGKKATVFTNQDVKNLKSSLGIETSDGVSDASGETGSGPTEPSAALERAISDSSGKLNELKKQKAELIREIQDTSDSIQQSGVHARNTGEQYRQKRLKEEELKKVEEQIEELEKQPKEPAQTEVQEPPSPEEKERK